MLGSTSPRSSSSVSLKIGSGRRRLSVTAYVEWTLGAFRATSAPFISTEIATSGAVFARNRRRWCRNFRK
jgi:cyclic beta-1,2-glucan synthetase